jgi:hypothetical protein
MESLFLDKAMGEILRLIPFLLEYLKSNKMKV